jgi:ribosomal protein S25
VILVGGAKKKSLAQMEKQQVQQDKKSELPQKKGKGKAVSEAKKSSGISLPNFDDEKFIGELSKIGALTPYSIATQFNVRLSVARDILEELERRRLVRSEGGNARIKIYRLAAA